MEEASRTLTERVVKRFDERRAAGHNGIGFLLYGDAFPDAVLENLYSRVDTCHVEELRNIHAVLAASTTNHIGYVSAYLEAVDTARLLKDRGYTKPAPVSFFEAKNAIIESFTFLGYPNIDEYRALTSDEVDLLIAHMFLCTINVHPDMYPVRHTYHMELDYIRSTIPFLMNAIDEFMMIWEMTGRFCTLREVVEATQCVIARGSENCERVIAVIEQRRGFDRTVLDMVLDHPSQAVAEGIL